MSSQYGVVVFGVPIQPVERFIKCIAEIDLPPNKLEELTEEWNSAFGKYGEGEPFGFKTLYSSSGDEKCGYLGIELSKIDTWNPIRLSNLKDCHPTPKQIKEVYEMVNRLPAEIRAGVGDPEIWIVWGST